LTTRILPAQEDVSVAATAKRRDESRLDALTRLPAARQESWVAPSGAASLLACKLRVAFASEHRGGRAPGSPATRLGNVCHAVLAQAAGRRFGTPGSPDWRERFEHAWDAALTAELRDLSELDLGRPWPPPAKWPFYAQRKTAARRTARELSIEAEEPGFAAEAEQRQQSEDGTLRGQPDLVVRSPVHEIRDYKTGSATDDTGSARPDYALQVQLYAALEHDTSGRWPERGVLIPLPGDPVNVDIDPQAAAAATQRAAESLSAYNAEVAAGHIKGLGSPSPSACRFCDYAPECEAFWLAWEPEWADLRLAAVAGQITEVREALRGGVSVELAVERGCSAAEAFTVHGLDPLTMPAVEQLSAGDAAAFVGLRVTSPGHGSATHGTRVLVRQANPATAAA